MKRIIINILMFLLLGSLGANATSYTWAGGTNTDWNTNSNWSPSTGHPISGDAVTISSSGTYHPVLTGNTTISRITISGGTLGLGGYSLTCSSSQSNFNGGTISNGNLILRGSEMNFAGATLSVTIDAIVDEINFNGGTFNNYCYFETTTMVPGSGSGGCTFNDSIYLFHNFSGSGIWRMNTSLGNHYNGKVKIKNISTAEITFAGAGVNVFNGDIILENTSDGGIYFGNDTLRSGYSISIGSAGYSDGEFRATSFYQAGSTSQSLTFTGTALPTLDEATFNGNFTITSNILLFKNCVFNNTSSFTATGSSSSSWSGGNKFYGNVTVTNNASAGTLRLDADTDNTFYGSATFAGTRELRLCYGGYGSTFHGNITGASNSNFTAGTGTALLTGSNNQTIAFTNGFGKLYIKKPAGNVTLSGNHSITGLLTLNKGNIVTSSGNLLTFTNTASVSSASDSSFIDGPVKKIGNSAFVFPVGKGSFYRALEITAPSSGTDAFTSEYYNTKQTLGDTSDTTIDYLSQCNYWKLNRNTGSSVPTVKLTWNQSDCGILDSADLRIAEWNGTKWKDRGYTSFTGTKASGKLSNSSTISSFNYFTLAYKTTLLPTAEAGPDTTFNQGSTYKFNGVSATNGTIAWLPEYSINCFNCDTPTFSGNFAMNYYLKVTDYKNRFAIDSVYLNVAPDPTTGVSSLSKYSPQVEWKYTEWAPVNPFTNANQTQDESSEDWWYGHNNSYDGGGDFNGYICTGYSKMANTGYLDSPYGGCVDITMNYSDWDCPDFETHTNLKGQTLNTIALKDSTGKGFKWIEHYATGELFNIIQTTDGDYLAVGRTYQTTDINHDLIYYNPDGITQELPCGLTVATGNRPHAYVIKVDPNGNLLWHYTYGLTTNNDIASDVNGRAFNVIETSFGYRVIGSDENPIGDGRDACYYDIDFNGILINSARFPITGVNQPIIPFSNAYGIDRYDDGGTMVNVVSGNITVRPIGYSAEIDIVWVMKFPEVFSGTLSPTWLNTSLYQTGAGLHSANYNVKVQTNTSPVRIIVPTIDDCANCRFSGNNRGVGNIYVLNNSNGNLTTGLTHNPVFIDNLGAYDLKVNVACTKDGGYGVVSSVHKFLVPPTYTCTGPSGSTTYNTGYWGADAEVTKVDVNNEKEWQTWWDVDDVPFMTSSYPGDYKKQECMYGITIGDDGGFVVSGNNSYNFDDFYFCKLHSDCDVQSIATATTLVCNPPSYVTTISTGTPVSWNSDRTVLGSVVVPNNATLIINGARVEFADSKRVSAKGSNTPIITNLIVQPGGRLEVINSAELDAIDGNSASCNDFINHTMWDGIQVKGQPYLAQNATNQGTIEVNTGSLIQNARYGILADNVTYARLYPLRANDIRPTNTGGGGTVQCDGALFNNNWISVQMGPYHKPSVSGFIISSDFTCTAPMRDRLYVNNSGYSLGSQYFVKLNSVKQFDMAFNTMVNSTSKTILPVRRRGGGIRAFDSGTSIASFSNIEGLDSAIYVDYSYYRSSPLYIGDNTFTDNGSAIFCYRGYNNASITRNSIELKPYFGLFSSGIWMYNTTLFTIYDNTLTGTSGNRSIGTNCTNSGNNLSKVTLNHYSNLGIGTQTEQRNPFLRINCNDYTTMAHSWVINPQSPLGILAQQGVSCSGSDVQAGNKFNDIPICVPASAATTKHIFSKIEFDYFGHGDDLSSTLEPTCISNLLQNGGLTGDVNYCASSSPDISCDNLPFICNDPSCLDSLVTRFRAETDPLEKQLKMGQIVQVYLRSDTTVNNAINFLDSLPKDSVSLRMLISLYLQEFMADSADAVLKILEDSSYIDSKLGDLYRISLILAYDSLTIYDMNSFEEAYIRELAEGDDEAGDMAKSILESVRGEYYERIPEEIEDERLGNNETQKDHQSSSANWFAVQPNPFTGQTKLIYKIDYKTQNATIKVINALGKVAYIQKLVGAGDEIIDLAQYTEGIYFCQLFINGSLQQTQKLILIK